jgi:hypothetical protein
MGMGASLMAPMFVFWINGLDRVDIQAIKPLRSRHEGTAFHANLRFPRNMGVINFADLDLESTTQKQF